MTAPNMATGIVALAGGHGLPGDRPANVAGVGA